MKHLNSAEQNRTNPKMYFSSLTLGIGKKSLTPHSYQYCYSRSHYSQLSQCTAFAMSVCIFIEIKSFVPSLLVRSNRLPVWPPCCEWSSLAAFLAGINSSIPNECYKFGCTIFSIYTPFSHFICSSDTVSWNRSCSDRRSETFGSYDNVRISRLIVRILSIMIFTVTLLREAIFQTCDCKI